MMVILRSLREIEMIREAGLVAWEAQQLAASMMRPGVTAGEIDAAVERLLHEHGATAALKEIPRRIPFPASIAVSINDAVLQGIPGPRVLNHGDMVSVMTACGLRGWCAEVAWTYPVDQPAPECERLLQVTHGALELAVDLLGRKSLWSEVAVEIEAYVKDNAFSVVEAFVGHGIGRELHEEPQVPNHVSRRLRETGDFRLVPGLVFMVEPIVNMGTKQVRTRRDHWTQVTADGRPSAHFGHTIAITESGPRLLTAGPDEAEVEALEQAGVR